MRSVVIGAHRGAEDVDGLAEVIAIGPLVLSGLTVDDDQPLGARELLLRVAATRAALLDRATFIAIRYGLTVHGPLEAMAKCAAHLDRWHALLEAHRDQVEMTLKVAAASPRPRPDRHDFADGASYLRALHQSVAAAEVSAPFREAAERAMGAGPRRWSHRDNRSLELAALVARADVPRVREAGQQLKETFADVPFLLSGPWPLEVFSDADHQ
jgi:hypothetical protein